MKVTVRALGSRGSAWPVEVASTSRRGQGLAEAKAELDAEAKAGLDAESGLVPREQLDTGEQD